MTESTRAPRTNSKRMRVIALVTLIALVVGMLGGWLIGAITSADEGGGDVWIIPAVGAEGADDALTLHGPGPVVAGISGDDGAIEQTGSANVSAVVQSWGDVFGDDDARALLLGTDASGDAVTVIVELGEPTATADSLTFPATRLGGGSLDGGVWLNVTLVVDGAGLLEAEAPTATAAAR